MKKLLLILLAAGGMATTDVVHAQEPRGLMGIDFSDISGDTCKEAGGEVEDLITVAEILKPPASPSSQEYHVKDWKTRTYRWRSSWAAGFLIYHKCYYDREATEIKILDMHSGRPVARYTEKNGYEDYSGKAEKAPGRER